MPLSFHYSLGHNSESNRMNHCKNCDKDFIKTTSKRDYTSYCSDRCQYRYWIDHNRDKWDVIKKNRWTEKNKRSTYSCCICGFNRSLDFAHIKWRKDGGRLTKDNIYVLCPNHHRLLDHGLLTSSEKKLLVSVKDSGI